MKRSRRVLSHHGSDCPDGPHKFRESRCLILTRIDRPGQLSEGWISGDCQETCSRAWKLRQAREIDWPAGEVKSERIYRKRHTFDPKLPIWYGGGFWDRVEIAPLPAPIVPCRHQTMIERRDDTTHAWECADCGHVYGEGEAARDYQVIIGNIGTVYSGRNLRDARFHARSYVDQSKRPIGRAAGESVSLLRDGELIEEYTGTLDQE